MRIIRLAAVGMLAVCSTVSADQAILVEEAVLVESNPKPDQPVFRASYKTSDGWAVTSPTYIDAATMVFDFGTTSSVSQAIISLPLEAIFTREGKAPLRVYVFADDGAIDLFDYKAGSTIPVAEFDAVVASGGNSSAVITLNVTGAVNATLPTSRYVGFRIQSTAVPADVTPGFPVWTGVKFRPFYSLEFSTGTPAPAPTDRPRFDGFTLSVPGLSAPGVGVFNVALALVDANNSEFALSAATDITPPGSISGSGLRGMSLLDCNAFTAPPGSQTLTPGAPVFNVNTGILEVPSVLFSGKEFSVQMQYLQGSNPMRFSLISFTEVTSGIAVPVNSITQFGGSLIIEPSQDFIPLCHGWVLIGDTSRNALVERNVISGETGGVYKFNTIPDQMLLDPDAGVVYLTTHPESQRLYQLDLHTGAFTYHRLREGGRSFIPRDMALGENGNVFTLLFDPVYDLEENGPAEEGLWMGIFNRDGDPEVPAIPLLSPIRIEYDPAQRHLFLATESNLVTFDFNVETQDITIVPGTDIPVGSGCTDFSISPGGQRLAYSCPQGNEPDPHTSIVDIDPRDYYNTDGEWYLENSPVSATFDQTGNVLIATDGIKLYYFDTRMHLLHDSYDLGLPDGEVVKQVRLSRDGKLVLIFIESGLNAKSGKIYWVPLPSFAPL
ncbi:MAG: hypothetical protein Q8L60_14670 [Gammaproteobacteria bacterium]|nr:hypothetical protein [Gammaproteobacteria bacterium]MDP2140168.1 hypothetical protein [Gammaproteobacteria bacterium]MDP2348044.1 hypothetical protein [Gammaproteobacteria bacterium]